MAVTGRMCAEGVEGLLGWNSNCGSTVPYLAVFALLVAIGFAFLGDALFCSQYGCSVRDYSLQVLAAVRGDGCETENVAPPGDCCPKPVVERYPWSPLEGEAGAGAIGAEIGEFTGAEW